MTEITIHAEEEFNGLPPVHDGSKATMEVSKRSRDGDTEPHLLIAVTASEPDGADVTWHEIELSDDEARRLAKWFVRYLI